MKVIWVYSFIEWLKNFLILYIEKGDRSFYYYFIVILNRDFV